MQFEISLKLDASEQRVYAILPKHAVSIHTLDRADGQCRVLAAAANREQWLRSSVTRSSKSHGR